jgi:hypothetical protein
MLLEDMSSKMVSMFDNCPTQQNRFCMLETDNCTLQQAPWAEPKKELNLRNGKSTFWLKHLPEMPKINGEPVVVQMCEPLTQSSMEDVLEDRLEFFMSQLKVLKVIDTEAARTQIARTVDYFKHLEASLKPPEDLAPLLQSGCLKNRAIYMRKSLQSRMRSVTTMMESIANDDKVRALNQAQQADYLRQMDVSKNSRALAKRAQTSGMEFESTLRKEILEMKAHLSELSEIDAKGHAVSFFSQATTLDGIQEVCAMADDTEVFEHITAVDLLRLFNVVGVPAVGPISDFPDPMTYRLDNIMAGNFISVADLSIVELAGQKLETPGTGIKISNAIPVFDDLRVQRFLQHHAPSCLEYICSIGMRRVLAEVPLTFPYTICSGVWRLIQQLDNDKSELNVKLLRSMMPSYSQSVKGRFDYLMPSLQVDQDPGKSFFLSHNGITNMISPLWRLVESGQLQHLPRILRALYSFETFQVMRRNCRQQDAKFYIEQLDKLLGVDFETRGTPLPSKFSRPAPTHTQKVKLNKEFFMELCKQLNHIKYATIMVQLFLAVRSEDPVAEAKKMPKISDETLVNTLDLQYPLQEFLLYNIVEGFLYQSKQSRVDKDTTISLRPDLGVQSEGQGMCQEYILQRYSEDYEYRLKQMGGEEKKQLCDELVEKLLSTDSMPVFNELLGNGLQQGDIMFQIANFNSQGCLELHEALLDQDRAVVKRSLKLQVFYTGEDLDQNSVWNGGNMYRTSTTRLQQLLTSIGEEATWLQIQERYKSKVSHVYREHGKCRCNRHGHSNTLPSYFALGHDILFSFVGAIASDAWLEYQQAHPHCCGVAKAIRDPEALKVSIERLAAKRAKRAECQHSQEKVNAAIDEKKRRKAARSKNVPVVAAQKRKVPTTSDSDSDNDDDSSDVSQC